MNRSGLALSVAILGAMAILVAVIFLGLSRRSSFADDYSSYRAEPKGTRAAYLLLEALGHPVERHSMDFERIQGRGLLVSIAPQAIASPFMMFFAGGDQPKEADGGTDINDDVYEDDGEGDMTEEPPVREPLFLETFTTYERQGLRAWIEGGGSFLLAIGHESAFLRDLGLSLGEEVAREEPMFLGRGQPSDLNRGADGVSVASYRPLVSQGGGFVSLYQGEAGPVAVSVPLGRGRVVVVSSPTLFSNEGIGWGGNGEFLAALASRLGQGGVLFDEAHHGFLAPRSALGYIRSKGFHLALIQLAFVLALALHRGFRAFGRPLPVVVDIRRPSSDFVLAMSNIYARVGYAHHALGWQAREMWRHLAHILRLPPGTEAEGVIAALRAGRRNKLAMEASRVEERLQALSKVDKVHPRVVLGLSQKIHRVVEIANGIRR